MGISARIVKRIITLLIVTLGVVTLSFCLQIFTGTDPAEMLVRKTTLFATEEQIQAMRVELGLDGTLSEQYADYIKGLLTGDLGISITNRKPVIDNIRNALPVTCMLVIMSMLWVAILTVLISAFSVIWKTSVYKGYKQDKIEMRGDRAEMSDFPLYLNTVAGGLDRRDQTIGGFSFVVKIYAVPVVEIIG